jgi:PKD repeat protein
MRNFTLLATSILFSLLISTTSYGQLREVPVAQRMAIANTIVEGEVISQQSFWDDNHKNIYTANKVLIYKTFKGNTLMNEVEVITIGGIVGNIKETVTHTLQLEVGQVGMFMLKNNNVAVSSAPLATTHQMMPATGPQGFVLYNLKEGTAKAPFHTYPTITNDLYNTVTAHTQSNYAVIERFDVDEEIILHNSYQRGGGPVITSISPTTVTSGTLTTLTINGSGFGATQGSGTVEFHDADDGGSSMFPALGSDIISWSDGQILVLVPNNNDGNAGTGDVDVVQGSTATSAQTLTISYSEINVVHDAATPGTDVAYQTHHQDMDGNGGYEWQMFTDFDANASANASFIRAMDNWRCTGSGGTGINWSIGAVTSTDEIASDGENVIRHDNGGELPGGVLGRCTSRFSGCIVGPSMEWYVTELDIAFDDGTNWNYGPASPGITEFDFESVALHELGHGHQLGHVIDAGAVMHYSIANGQESRILSANDLAAGNDVHSRSTTLSHCGEDVMTDFTGCGAPAPVAEFSGTPLSICAGSTVTFTDASTNATGWTWNFGAGATPATASTQGPHVVTYSSSGNKTVSLDVTGPGGSDNESKASYVTVNALPNLSSTSSTDETCATNDGTATVSPSGGSGSYTYLWDIAAASQTTPTATALAAGTYGVTVTDAVSGCTAGTSVIVGNNCNPVPDTKIRTVDCGRTVTNFHDYFYCDGVANATHYQFRFTDGPTVLTEIRTSQQMKFQWLVGVDHGITYTVDVRAKVGGQWGSYNVTCTVSTPAFTPSTNLTSAFCNTSQNQSTTVYADFLLGADKYQFKLTDQNPPNNTLVKFSNNNNFKPSQISGITNTTYDVIVRARIGGNWIAFGSTCSLTITGASSMVIYGGPPQGHRNLEIENNGEPTTVTIYPNPNNGQFVFLNVNNAGAENNKMLVNVTDLYGKIVYSEQMPVSASYTHQQITFNRTLAKGMYFVNVIIGEEKYSNKMIIK